MKREEITRPVMAAIDGSKKLKITFKKEATRETLKLLGMEKVGNVGLDDNVKIDLFCVGTSGNWEMINRTVVVTLTDKFRKDDEARDTRSPLGWFIDKMMYALEGIEAID